ncbi:MAG: hypothetical protein KZQ97_21495, partial [Candidatus Thiodiazotropha sp. (ex Dulcina madagascariensis)]|nr:hypothetical protein [Candidatus Thiodiazotropha sp. (ex Dulcina madagascariensis)]
MPQDQTQRAGNGSGPCQALQRRIEALTGLPSGEALSRHLRCCVAWKGRAIPGATRLAANGLASR